MMISILCMAYFLAVVVVSDYSIAHGLCYSVASVTLSLLLNFIVFQMAASSLFEPNFTGLIVSS